MGDNAGGAAVMQRPIMFQCAGFGILAGLPGIYTYNWPYIYVYIQFRLGAKLYLRRTFGYVNVA